MKVIKNEKYLYPNKEKPQELAKLMEEFPFGSIIVTLTDYSLQELTYSIPQDIEQYKEKGWNILRINEFTNTLIATRENYAEYCIQGYYWNTGRKCWGFIYDYDDDGGWDYRTITLEEIKEIEAKAKADKKEKKKYLTFSF